MKTNFQNDEKIENHNNLENITLKVNFIGDSKSGKTSLIKSLLYSKYIESTNDSILNLYHVDLNAIDNYNVSLNIL